ncbi:hypothetical protein BBJ28_00016698 [Nothophytophthora sp. Chile5]|nr:hypothetical protein BBJ28_00016698 [Nothophytophthora sp. Chile5]
MQCTPTECAPGSGSVEGASTPTESCSVCVSGFYSPGGGHPCLPVECAVGWASSDAGATSALDSCVECPAGSFSAGGGAQCEATLCIPGTASPSGAFSVDGQCVPCSVGLFSPGGEAQCQPAMCPTGSAAPPGAATMKGDCMQCAEGFHSAGGASPCLACECAAGFSCKGSQPVCKKCYAGQTAAGGSDRCGSKDTPTDYLELAMELEGYTASMFNDEVLNALATGLRGFLTAAASVSSLDGAESEMVCTERSVETPESLKERPWGASYVLVDITLRQNVVSAFEAFLKVYETPVNDLATTSNSTNVTDGNDSQIDDFAASLRSHGLARLRSAQLRQVVAWQNGEEVARVGSSSSRGRTLLPLVLSIGVGVAMLLVVVMVLAVRVGHRHASQSHGSLESGRRETLDGSDGFDRVSAAPSESMQGS